MPNLYGRVQQRAWPQEELGADLVQASEVGAQRSGEGPQVVVGAEERGLPGGGVGSGVGSRKEAS